MEDRLDIEALTSVFSSRDFPDEMRMLRHPADLVFKFVSEVTRLLMSDDVQIRDVARDALGAELSPRLYPSLMKHIEE